MKTIKWFRIGVPVSIEVLAQKIKDNPFKNDCRFGFILNKSTINEISGRFIEEKPFIKEISNPFGVSETIRILDFNVIEFTILKVNSNWLLQVYGTPRSIKPLTNKLANLIGFGFYVESINLDLKSLIECMEHDFGKLNIIKMELYNINIQNTALAQMLITSTKDVRKSLNDSLINNMNYEIHSITARFSHHDSYSGSVEIKSNSRIDFSDMPVRLFLSEYTPIFFNLIFKNK